MSTDQSTPLAADNDPASPPRGDKRGWGGWIAGAALAAFALFFIANCRVALDPRVANPNVHGRPRPVRFLFGLDYITFLRRCHRGGADRAARSCSSGAGGATRAAR